MEKLKNLLSGLFSKKLLGLGLVVVLLIATTLSVYLVRQRQTLRSKADTQGSVDLFFAPSSVTLNTTNNFDVDVKLSAGNNPITGVDITLRYGLGITPTGQFQVTGGNFDTVIVPGSSDNGLRSLDRTIHFLAVNKGGPGSLKQGDIDLGKITFTPDSANASGTVTFLSSRVQVVASNYSGTQRVNLGQHSTFSYSPPGATSTPIPPPGATNTPTPTAAPAATNTPTLTPTPAAVRGDVSGPAGHPDRCLSELDRAYIVNLWQNNNYDSLADLKVPPDGHFILQEDVNIWDSLYLADIIDRCH